MRSSLDGLRSLGSLETATINALSNFIRLGEQILIVADNSG